MCTRGIPEKMEINMKIYSRIGVLLLSSVMGLLILNNNNVRAASDLYVIDTSGNLVKLDLTNTSDEANLTMNELPNYVSFALYTRATNDTPEELIIGDVDNLTNSHFDADKPTKFVTHGWMSSCDSDICIDIRSAFLEHGDYNVIQVDWSNIAAKSYIWASNQVENVAKLVSRMLDFLVSQGQNPANITVVGHSLGAHVAGLSSYYAKQKVSYVVGMDPAGPLFYLRDEGHRISKGDADYVEAIHTTTLLGLIYQVGDSDFYPNGALPQGGCGLDLGESCSHGRSYEYYAESINDDRFIARQCDNYVEYQLNLCDSNSTARMGGVTPDYSAEGKYYLFTNPETPYAEG